MPSASSEHSLRSLLKNKEASDQIVLVLSSWFFLGFIRGAPGTYGTLGAIVPCLVLRMIPLIPRLVFLAFFVWASMFLSRKAQVLLGKNDPSQVVIDEVAGFMVATIMIPMTFVNICMAFVLFRLFDIFKPFPVNVADRKLKGGVGIVADDLLAGGYALLCVKLINLFVKVL